MKYRILLYFLFFLILAAKPQTVEAQNVAISTNAVDWLNFGTANIGVGVDVSRHFSVEAGARYNPWSFIRKSSGLAVMNRQTTAFVGVRFWPWYIFSGWWIAARCQYSDFSDTGIWRYALNEGKALGASLSFGYTLMLSKHFFLMIYLHIVRIYLNLSERLRTVHCYQMSLFLFLITTGKYP